MFRAGVLRMALKRGYFIEFDAKQFFDCSVFHQGPYLDAMIVDNNRSLVAEMLLEEAPAIVLQAEDIGYSVVELLKSDDRARYKFALPAVK